MRLAHPSVAIAVVMLLSRSAFADPESDAKDLFTRGREFRQRNDCASAAPLFRRAYDVYPKGLGSLRNLAECEEQNGRFASARRSWLDLKRALVTYSDPKYAGWDADADGAATRLAPKVAHVTIEVPSSSGSAPEVFLNGERLSRELIGTVLDRDPGTYLVRVVFSQDDTHEEKLELAPGDTKRLLVQAKDRSGASANVGAVGVTKGETRDASARPPAPLRKANGWMSPVGWSLVGVGGASLVGSLVATIVRGNARSDLDARCPSHLACDPSLESTVSRGETASTLAPVLLGAGVVLAGVGISLVVLHGSNKKTVEARFAPHSLDLGVTF